MEQAEAKMSNIKSLDADKSIADAPGAANESVTNTPI